MFSARSTLETGIFAFLLLLLCFADSVSNDGVRATLLVVTIDGGLYGVDKYSGHVKWSGKVRPIIGQTSTDCNLDFSLHVNPNDGQLFIKENVNNAGKDVVLHKIPYKIPDLVTMQYVKRGFEEGNFVRDVHDTVDYSIISLINGRVIDSFSEDDEGVNFKRFDREIITPPHSVLFGQHNYTFTIVMKKHNLKGSCEVTINYNPVIVNFEADVMMNDEFLYFSSAELGSLHVVERKNSFYRWNITFDSVVYSVITADDTLFSDMSNKNSLTHVFVRVLSQKMINVFAEKYYNHSADNIMGVWKFFLDSYNESIIVNKWFDKLTKQYIYYSFFSSTFGNENTNYFGIKNFNDFPCYHFVCHLFDKKYATTSAKNSIAEYGRGKKYDLVQRDKINFDENAVTPTTTALAPLAMYEQINKMYYLSNDSLKFPVFESFLNSLYSAKNSKTAKQQKTEMYYNLYLHRTYCNEFSEHYNQQVCKIIENDLLEFANISAWKNAEVVGPVDEYNENLIEHLFNKLEKKSSQTNIALIDEFSNQQKEGRCINPKQPCYTDDYLHLEHVLMAITDYWQAFVLLLCTVMIVTLVVYKSLCNYINMTIQDRLKKTEKVVPADSAKIQLNSLVVFLDRQIFESKKNCFFMGSFDSKNVLVKRMSMREYFTEINNEIVILQKLPTNKNLVKYYCKEYDDKFAYIAFEYMKINLNSFVLNNRSEIEGLRNTNLLEQLIDMGAQILAGLKYLHDSNISHNDLKSCNILLKYHNVEKSFVVAIGDFGSCRAVVSESSEHEHENEENNQFVDVQNDMMSFGKILTFMFFGEEKVFSDEEVDAFLEKIRDINNEDMDYKAWPFIELVDLISWLTSKKGQTRPDCGQALMHPLFWDLSKKVQFVIDISNYAENEVVAARLNQILFKNSVTVVRVSWGSLLPEVLWKDLVSNRRYNAWRIKDLLRVVRNKKSHFNHSNEDVKSLFNYDVDQLMAFFFKRFYKLVMHCYHGIGCSHYWLDKPFAVYYGENSWGVQIVVQERCNGGVEDDKQGRYYRRSSVTEFMYR